MKKQLKGTSAINITIIIGWIIVQFARNEIHDRYEVLGIFLTIAPVLAFCNFIAGSVLVILSIKFKSLTNFGLPVLLIFLFLIISWVIAIRFYPYPWE